MGINIVYFLYLALFTLPLFSLVSLLDGKELRWQLLPAELQAALQGPHTQACPC